mgnify:FL=1
MNIENFIDFFDKSLLTIAKKDIRYENSIFKHIRYLPPRTKGSFFEKLSKNIFQKLSFQIDKPQSSDHDMIVNNRKIEVKGSTLGMNKNTFSFLQIRPDQDYEVIIFVMAYPKELKILEMTKKDVIKNIENNVFKKQHGGKKADSRTFCYYGNYESLLKIGATPLKMVNK